MAEKRLSAWDIWTRLLPIVSGFAFYGWMEWHPWTRGRCDAPVWTALTWIPFLAVPPIATGIRLRRTDHDWQWTISSMVLVLLLTGLICFVAFGLSFTHLNCGE